MAIAGRRSTGTRPVIVVLALASITLIALDNTFDDGPAEFARAGVQDIFASVSDTARSPFGEDDLSTRLREENAALKLELEQLKGSTNEQVDAQRELDRITALLELPTPSELPKVITRVTAHEGTNFNSTIEIGKGTDSGVRPGMPVVSGEGLVGRVVQASSKRATVLLLTDTTSNIGVRVATTGEVAVAVGQGAGNPLRVDLIDVQSAAKPGDVVVTSGMQKSLFPPGIPLGKISSSEASSQDLRRDVRVLPLIAVDALDNVAVLQWEPEAVSVR